MSTYRLRLSSTARRNTFLVLITLLPLWIYANAGIFVPYVADDYCASNVVRSIGIVPTVVQYYTSWTGIFTAIFYGL